MSPRILPRICCVLAVVTAGSAVLTGQQRAQAAPARHAAQARPAARAVPAMLNQHAATYVKSLEGTPYVYGGTGRRGFDCSGLTSYVYGRLGSSIARTAEDQFRQFRPVSRSRAWGGDLVFFHTSSDPHSHVYHVGVYEGGHQMVAASSSAGRVIWESFSWAGDTVTFGTLTH